MEDTRNKLRLIWADKIALSLTILIVAIPAFGWVLVAIAAGPAGANHVIESIGMDGALEVMGAVLTVWAALRGVDFAAGGATYKLFHAAPADAQGTTPAGDVADTKLLAH
jgi:hypothetical protein